MEKLSFRLEVFEGPLDVLLHLLSKNKINIYDIQISELLDQYMEYLGKMREMDLEITSDFLEMASRLVQIKTAMLLPRHEEESGDDLRAALIADLIGYKACREAADELSMKATGFDSFTREPSPPERDNTYKCRHDPSVIYNAFLSVCAKSKRRLPPPVSAFTGVVGRKIISVTSRMIYIMRRLIKEGRRPFISLFENSKGRSESVATFLALLELVKSGRIKVLEDENQSVLIKKRA